MAPCWPGIIFVGANKHIAREQTVPSGFGSDLHRNVVVQSPVPHEAQKRKRS